MEDLIDKLEELRSFNKLQLYEIYDNKQTIERILNTLIEFNYIIKNVISYNKMKDFKIKSGRIETSNDSYLINDKRVVNLIPVLPGDLVYYIEEDNECFVIDIIDRFYKTIIGSLIITNNTITLNTIINYPNYTFNILNPSLEYKNVLCEYEIISVYSNIIDVKFAKKISTQSNNLLLQSIYNINVVDSTSNDIASINDSEYVDLTDLPFVTIDGFGAKDFDDAIYVTDTKLYVAIADVSAYIKKDSDLDLSAKEKGFSLYLNGKVFPMFPEFISNDLCSLNTNCEKYAVIFEIGLYNKSIKFYRAKIKIKHRLIYGNDDDFIKTQFPNIIKAYNHLKIFSKYKLNLDVKYPTYKYENSEPKILKRWYPKPLSSDIIEVFMIECNSRIAEYLAKNSIGIYRHHPEYDKKKLSRLNNYLQHLNWKLQIHQKDYLINDSLNKLISKYDHNSLKYLILFNTPKAIYSIDNSSHSNINRQFYTHMTSPIRRYIDLIIHRLLFNPNSYSLDELNDIINHVNFIEERNNSIYRKNDDILVLKYINNQPKDTLYNCRVIGINKYTVTLIIENLNYIINLSSDYFGDKLLFDENKMILSEKYGDTKIKPFDIIQIKINNIDMINFKLDVEII